jgi:hypothetical protein
MDERPGCLSGLFKLFLVDFIFDFMQEKFGFGRGGCCGCGCGVILFILSTAAACVIILGTDWFNFGF